MKSLSAMTGTSTLQVLISGGRKHRLETKSLLQSGEGSITILKKMFLSMAEAPGNVFSDATPSSLWCYSLKMYIHP